MGETLLDRLIEAERKRLEKEFLEPEYHSYEIEYVTEKEKADVAISYNSDIFDYLAIGLSCLAKTINDPKGKKVIYVFKEKFASVKQFRRKNEESLKETGCMCFVESAIGTEDIFKKITNILNTYSKVQDYDNHLAGVVFYIGLSSEVIELTGNYPVKFEKFDDTVASQRNAFESLKALVISNCLGILRQSVTFF